MLVAISIDAYTPGYLVHSPLFLPIRRPCFSLVDLPLTNIIPVLSDAELGMILMPSALQLEGALDVAASAKLFRERLGERIRHFVDKPSSHFRPLNV